MFPSLLTYVSTHFLTTRCIYPNRLFRHIYFEELARWEAEHFTIKSLPSKLLHGHQWRMGGQRRERLGRGDCQSVPLHNGGAAAARQGRRRVGGNPDSSGPPAQALPFPPV